MSKTPEPAIRVRVNPTNPGQFFACCGLLELADRLWGRAEGWFEGSSNYFCIRSEHDGNVSTGVLFEELVQCKLTNTMTDVQLHRREQLHKISTKELVKTPTLKAEIDELDNLWRESPILLHEPFNLRLDWFNDERAGGKNLKTWAGRQSVMDVALGMMAPINAGEWRKIQPDDWLFKSTKSSSLPFYFDSGLGELGSDRDIGFSLDPLNIKIQTRPLLEIAAFVGLQRFRPIKIENENRYQYSIWFDPLNSRVATAAVCGLIDSLNIRIFEFPLIYRTKYLKSFPQAKIIGGKK